MRLAYITLRDFSLEPFQRIKLTKLYYDISESRNYWKKFRHHFEKELGVNACMFNDQLC